jgi:hypothetical protein
MEVENCEKQKEIRRIMPCLLRGFRAFLMKNEQKQKKIQYIGETTEDTNHILRVLY